MEKRKNLRKSAKYPALFKKYNLLSRKQLIDYDYLKKLGPEELEFLNNFTENEILASVKKDDSEYTKEEKERIWSENNARNRDFYNRRRRVFLDSLSDEEEVAVEDINDSGFNKTDRKIMLEIFQMSPEEFDVFFNNNSEFFSKEFRERYECLRIEHRK